MAVADEMIRQTMARDAGTALHPFIASLAFFTSQRYNRPENGELVLQAERKSLNFDPET